jgi:3-deoxy-D-manno-octulosonic-acid transferase
MVAAAKTNKIPATTRVKWSLFRLLERLSDMRGNSAGGHLELTIPAIPAPSIWVFVSTIGELNAIDPLLREIVIQVPQLKIVLITDHPHYRASYLARYPQAEICVTRGHAKDAAALAVHYPPRLLVVAEIPCWPSDAPCRFSFAFLFEAKQAGALAVLVNAWLYHYETSSRMDAIERRFFKGDYLRSFDAIGAQTAATRDHLLDSGANANTVAVTGNIKFDGMSQTNWTPAVARSPVLLTALTSSLRQIIVTGCITDFDEQEMVLDAFCKVREAFPGALLVLAPRHPEVAERMKLLRTSLAQRKLRSTFRSTMDDVPIGDDTACLVLDTMGELRDFYAVAKVTHVGVDHNVLEPMGFGKPVTVKPGWDKTFPSYPVYTTLMQGGALLEADDATKLLAHWLPLLQKPAHYQSRIEATSAQLASLKGAVARHLDQILPLLIRIGRGKDGAN